MGMGTTHPMGLTKPQLHPQQMWGGGNQMPQPRKKPIATNAQQGLNYSQKNIPKVNAQQPLGLANPNIVDNQPNSDYNLFSGAGTNVANFPGGGNAPYNPDYYKNALSSQGDSVTWNGNTSSPTDKLFNTDGLNLPPEAQYPLNTTNGPIANSTQQASVDAPEMSQYQKNMLEQRKRETDLYESSQMTGFERGLQNTSNIVGMASSLGNAYLAYKNYGLAKDTYKDNKAMANRNLANQAKMVNADIMNRNSVGLALGGAAMSPEQRAAATATARNNRVDGSAI